MAEQFDPISHIEWLHYSVLCANDYNPNVVFTPELKLLERSILMTGWVQPVLAVRYPERVQATIIDGFHRWALTRDSKELHKRYGGLLPVALLKADRADAMILTIRMNRAKGSHVAIRMHEMVRELVDEYKISKEQLMIDLGATREEIDLLYQEGIFTHKDIANYRYSKAWVPKETRNG